MSDLTVNAKCNLQVGPFHTLMLCNVEIVPEGDCLVIKVLDKDYPHFVRAGTMHARSYSDLETASDRSRKVRWPWSFIKGLFARPDTEAQTNE
jgi:hypothetical protein